MNCCSASSNYRAYPSRRFGQMAVAAWTLLLLASGAQAQIKSPGAHPSYSVELEPRGLVQWDVEPPDDEGFGLGLRASIPVMDNGPVQTINNSLAIGFGLDWAWSGDDCPARYDPDYDCDAHNFTVPITAQWNFFFSQVVSAFFELGIGIVYETWDYPAWGDGDDIDPEPIFLLGVRFHVGDNIAIPIRIGWPYFAVGVAFLL